MPTLTAINHLAFITPDLTKTIRFWRDLLGLELRYGVGHDGYRHYFFQMGPNTIAFFEYAGASAMTRKFHGVRTSEPRGFDHVSFTVASCEELFSFKDKLEAAGLEVTGAIDHGTFWSIYFYDPNNIPLEISWECMEITSTPAISEDDPMPIVAEGADPQPGHWPEPTKRTPRESWTAKPGNAHEMRRHFLEHGLAHMTAEGEPIIAANDSR